MLATYDDLILDPLLREYFGPAGYYNVGYWDNGCRNQEEACDRLVERLVADVERPARVLDAGCGLGASTRLLARKWPEAAVLGVNNSVRQLNVANGLRRLAGDASQLAVRDDAVDVVVSVEAAFHFRTREAFLREAARVLVAGGQLAMSDILFQGTSWPGAWTVPPENAVADVVTYRRLLERAGFGEIAIEDATDVCWNPFCGNLRTWIGHQSGVDVSQWDAMIAQLRNQTVRHYVIVSATVVK